MEANMAKKIWTVTLADDLINSLRFDSANVLRRIELCPQKWTFGHTKTDTYRFKEQFHRFETVMPETRYEDDVSH